MALEQFEKDQLREPAAQHIAELRRALVLARCGLAEAHEAAIRKGQDVNWDILKQRLRNAHDAVHTALNN